MQQRGSGQAAVGATGVRPGCSRASRSTVEIITTGSTVGGGIIAMSTHMEMTWTWYTFAQNHVMH